MLAKNIADELSTFMQQFTGLSSGIEYEAKLFARDRFNLVLVARSQA